MRAHRPSELVRHRRERAELGVGAPDEVGQAQLVGLLERRRDEPAGVLDEGDGVGEEALDLGPFHHVVVRRQEPPRPECGDRSRGAEVALDVEVRRRADHVALHVEQAAAHHGVHHDRGAGRGIPEPDVPCRVPRKVEDLHDELGPEADPLPAPQADIHRAVGAHGLGEPCEHVGRVREAVRGVPAVALAQDRLGALDPGHVELVCQEDGMGSRAPDCCVAAEVVDVRVGVEDEVGLIAPEEREDHLGGRVLNARVDEERALPGEQVLGERARPENALDAVDTGCDFHGGQTAPSGRFAHPTARAGTARGEAASGRRRGGRVAVTRSRLRRGPARRGRVRTRGGGSSGRRGCSARGPPRPPRSRRRERRARRR